MKTDYRSSFAKAARPPRDSTMNPADSVTVVQVLHTSQSPFHATVARAFGVVFLLLGAGMGSWDVMRPCEYQECWPEALPFEYPCKVWSAYAEHYEGKFGWEQWRAHRP